MTRGNLSTLVERDLEIDRRIFRRVRDPSHEP